MLLRAVQSQEGAESEESAVEEEQSSESVWKKMNLRSAVDSGSETETERLI